MGRLAVYPLICTASLLNFITEVPASEPFQTVPLSDSAALCLMEDVHAVKYRVDLLAKNIDRDSRCGAALVLFDQVGQQESWLLDMARLNADSPDARQIVVEFPLSRQQYLKLTRPCRGRIALESWFRPARIAMYGNVIHDERRLRQHAFKKVISDADRAIKAAQRAIIERGVAHRVRISQIHRGLMRLVGGKVDLPRFPFAQN